VCDASALVALLVDDGEAGTWVTRRLSDKDLLAPHLVAFETANILRRLELASLLSIDQAAQAHADLLDLAIELWPYDLLAGRSRQLRANLTTYDASYVALAEAADVPLVTLDHRIARAPDVRCAVLSPPSS
jgi:predicted nucleic acid-binding protein